MAQGTPGPFVAQPFAPEQSPPLWGRAEQAEILGDLSGDLGRIPGALACFDPLTHLSEHRLGDGGRLAWVWLVIEAVKAFVQKSLDPGADGALMQV